jgi:hypothetical protein
MTILERLSRILTDHPITDKLTVQTTAVVSGAGTVAVDTMIHTKPELWLGFSIVDWAAIFSICLALIAILEKFYKWYKKIRLKIEERKQKKNRLKELSSKERCIREHNKEDLEDGL